MAELELKVNTADRCVPADFFAGQIERNNNMVSESVIVVGAGIAGLTAAYQLSKFGVDVRVLEAAQQIGGRMVTDTINGYVIDSGA